MTEITTIQAKQLLQEINPTFLDREIAIIKIDNNGTLTVLNEEDGSLVYTLLNYTIVTKASVRMEFLNEDQSYFKTFRAITSDEQLDTKVNNWENKSGHELGCECEIKLNNEWVGYDMDMWTM